MLRRATIAIVALLGAATAARAGVEAKYLHALTDGTSKPAFGWASMAWHSAASELYVVDNAHGVVEVFNDNGVAIHSFSDRGAHGLVQGVAVLESGEPFVLTSQGGSYALVRCNYRGDQIARLALGSIPKEFAAGFSPNALHAANGKLYLADLNAMKVLSIEADGSVVSTHDLAALLGVTDARRGDAVMRGFSVDGDGSLLFTVATLFQAFVVSTDGRVRAFGIKGSVPGRFGVAGGIAADGEGHLFVSDTLRGVVLAFDRETFRFLGEFGTRGRGASDLINPLHVVVGNRRVYVTQSVGPVKVFAVRFD